VIPRLHHRTTKHMFLKRGLLLVAGLLLLATLAACSGGEKRVRGHVMDVQGASLTDVASLTLMDAQGKTWRFQSTGNIGFTPSHVREHMMLGQEMTVTYTGNGDDLLALRLTD